MNRDIIPRLERKNIKFDVSIEVFRKGATIPYLIWVWECKNYTKKVPVDDVEEFHAKLNQIGANRTKGTLITPSGFDESALQFARSEGIGLWRWIPENTPIISLEARTTSNNLLEDQDVIGGLTATSIAYAGVSFLGTGYGMTCDGQLVTDCHELFKAELTDSL
ncbi:restriction endonuclease [Leptolyngbya sp. AN02str]|uniref:restriction endonuclease n=1 Tax=Leptolyngbya sp. AN02str TaxID=3423363 RepID=UPI003D317387